MSGLDPALRGFVDAGSEEEAERQLEALIERRLGPLVRTIVARKLRAFGTRKGTEPEDLEDAAGDALLLLLKQILVLRVLPESTPIESLDDYTATLTYNVCAHHLRRRYPERSFLKNRLRYFLGRDKRFAIWETATAGLRCGLSRWRGEEPVLAVNDRLAALERDHEQLTHSWPPASPRDADPAPLIGDILRRVNGPIEFDRLVGLVASIWRVDRQPTVESSSLVGISDERPAPEIAIDRRRFAERLWTEVQELPVRQRVALLLNLRDGRGVGVLWVLPVTGVASMRSIASALDMPFDELANMWSTLPIDDNAIAERLGCARQQVINLRMSARKRLGNRLKANLRRVSTSMRIDT